MQQMLIYWQSIVPQHVSGVFTSIISTSTPQHNFLHHSPPTPLRTYN